eukprot:Skav213533  [mRNA]  locus=scaffold1184:94656:97609:- [translate_table: standard]
MRLEARGRCPDHPRDRVSCGDADWGELHSDRRAQFLSPRVIERLRNVSAMQGVPVMCFGLRTDFRSRLFEGSKRLMELADSIEEVKTTCACCSKKGTMNLRSVNGKASLEGPTVCLGAEEMYAPVCYMHFCEKIVEATGGPIDFPAAWAAGDKADAMESFGKDEAVEEPELERSPQKLVS